MSKNGMEQEENVMKKIIAILLSVMLLLGCVAAAEETGKTTIGTISINDAFTLQCGLPEGYQVKPVLLSQKPSANFMRHPSPPSAQMPKSALDIIIHIYHTINPPESQSVRREIA